MDGTENSTCDFACTHKGVEDADGRTERFVAQGATAAEFPNGTSEERNMLTPLGTTDLRTSCVMEFSKQRLSEPSPHFHAG